MPLRHLLQLMRSHRINCKPLLNISRFIKQSQPTRIITPSIVTVPSSHSLSNMAAFNSDFPLTSKISRVMPCRDSASSFNCSQLSSGRISVQCICPLVIANPTSIGTPSTNQRSTSIKLPLPAHDF